MPNKKTDITKIFLWCMIAFFIISGLIGAFAFLFNTWSETIQKILMTTIALGIFSLLSLASSKLIKKKRTKYFAMVGIGGSVIASVLILLFIWEIIDSNDTIGKAAAISSIIAFSIAHASLLMGEIKKKFTKYLLLATLSLISIVAVMVIVLILNEGIYFETTFWKFFGFFIVLDVVGTIITPLSRKIK